MCFKNLFNMFLQQLKKKSIARILVSLNTAGKWSAFMRKTEYYKFTRLPDADGNVRISNPCFKRNEPELMIQIESKYISGSKYVKKVKEVKEVKEVKVKIPRQTPKRRLSEFQDAIPTPHGWKMSKLGGDDDDWSAYLPKEI